MRVLLFLAAGVATGLVLSLTPDEWEWLAWVTVLVVTVLGGLLAARWVEFGALVLGTAVGGTVGSLGQLGQPQGPSSPGATFLGAAVLALLMLGVGALPMRLRRRARMSRAAAPGGAGGTAVWIGGDLLQPNTLSVDLRPGRLTIRDSGEEKGPPEVGA